MQIVSYILNSINIYIPMKAVEAREAVIIPIVGYMHYLIR